MIIVLGLFFVKAKNTIHNLSQTNVCINIDYDWIDVSEGCRGLVQEVWNLKDVGDVAAKGNNNKIHFCYVNMDKAINIMKNSNLREKCRPF